MFQTKIGKAKLTGLLIGVSVLAFTTPAFSKNDSDLEQVFYNSSYTYCDAKILGAAWNMTPEQGKIAIGQKISAGFEDLIPGVLQQGRDRGERCDWVDVPHNYDDAVLLAEFWETDPQKAKLKIADMYTQGRSDTVKMLLENRNRSEAEWEDMSQSEAETEIPMSADVPLKRGKFERGVKYASPNGSHYVTFQSDGNVVVYTRDGGFVWGLNQVSPNYFNAENVIHQDDGNFGVYDGNMGYIWSALHALPPSGTALYLTDDGRLQLKTPNGELLWSS